MEALNLVEAGESVLVVIDVQERLAPAIDKGAQAKNRVKILLQAAKKLQIPMVVTEQYPKGLGRTVSELLEDLGEGAVVEKITFSAFRDETFRERLTAARRRQIVICGMETHVCVLQTALELRREDYEVFVVADACGSRNPQDKEIALQRLAQGGCHLVTSEMVLFEWLGVAGTPLFREISALIK